MELSLSRRELSIFSSFPSPVPIFSSALLCSFLCLHRLLMPLMLFYLLSFTLWIFSSIPLDIYRYLPLVDIFLSQVGISVFPLLNLFPAYVLFCQLFRDLVNICTERPAGNQPVGVSSLCVNWSRSVCVSVCMCACMGKLREMAF